MTVCKWSAGPLEPRCLNPNHDHDGYDMNGSPTGERMHCNDCGAPSHYDMTLDDYRHDDMDAPPCFLIPFYNRCPEHKIDCDGYGNCPECES